MVYFLHDWALRGQICMLNPQRVNWQMPHWRPTMTPGDIVGLVLGILFLVSLAPLMVRFKGDKR